MPSAEAQSPATTTTILGHPRGLFLLFFVEMWERFSYYGMRALLILYLIHEAAGGNPGRGWSKAEASDLYGWYTGLAYLTPLFGGMIADRVLGTHRSLLVGGALIALGHATLALTGCDGMAGSELGMSLFIAGLMLVVLGTGHFKPSVSVMVGQLYAADDPRRDGAFTIFYMGINLGGFLCVLVCGTLGEKVGWHWGFGAAALGMIAGLALYCWGRPLLPERCRALPRAGADRSPLYLTASILIAATVGALYRAGAISWLGRAMDGLMGTGADGLPLTAVLSAAALAWSAWYLRRQPADERGATAGILIFIAFNAVFWLAFEQAGSSLNIFAMERTDRLLCGFEVPATWFQSINPLVIILCGALFAALWSWLGRHGRNPSQAVKIALALFLVGGGYIVMVIGSLQALSGGKAGMIWLTATYVLHTWGELCISPTGLAFVSRTAPVRQASFLMGMWFLANVVANKAGGMLAAQVEGIEQGSIGLFWYPWFRLGGQADFFLLFVILSGVAGVVILLLAPTLDRLGSGRR